MTEKSTDYILEQLGMVNNCLKATDFATANAFGKVDEGFKAIDKTLNGLIKSNKKLRNFNRAMVLFSAACCVYAYFNEKRLNKIESEMKELKNQKGD